MGSPGLWFSRSGEPTVKGFAFFKCFDMLTTYLFMCLSPWLAEAAGARKMLKYCLFILVQTFQQIFVQFSFGGCIMKGNHFCFCIETVYGYLEY